MEFYTLKRQVFGEMAAMQHRDMFPADAEVWAKSTGEDIENVNKFIFGQRKGTKTKDWYDTYGRLIAVRHPDYKDGQWTIKQVRDYFIKNGYKKVKAGKPTGKTSTYANGEQQEGTTGTFTGTVYHGTPNILFFREAYGSSGFGGGSHLQSLNEKDAFSITPDFSVAEGFSESGMIIEYHVKNMKVYYASRDEDDFDEIEYPEGTHAVAIPHGLYKENEFAVVYDDGFLIPKYVHLQVKDKWKKYDVGQVDLYGEENTFLEKWFYDLFGKDFSKILDRYDDVNRRIVDEEVVDDMVEYVKVGRVVIYFEPPHFKIDDDKNRGVDYDKKSYGSANEFLRKPPADWKTKDKDEDE